MDEKWESSEILSIIKRSVGKNLATTNPAPQLEKTRGQYNRLDTAPSPNKSLQKKLITKT
jgi:hypothetical protein